MNEKSGMQLRSHFCLLFQTVRRRCTPRPTLRPVVALLLHLGLKRTTYTAEAETWVAEVEREHGEYNHCAIEHIYRDTQQLLSVIVECICGSDLLK